jgi:hypothetical protein
VLERRKSIGTVLMSVGGFIMLIEIVGMLAGTIGGPEILYFMGGVFEGMGVVFFLGGFVIREEFQNTKELM